MKPNDLTKKVIIAVAMVVTVIGCSYAGRVEYNDVVLSGMSSEKYRYINNCLGGYSSQEDVVKEYIANQEYYNSINSNYGF